MTTPNDVARAYFDYAITGIIETNATGRIQRANPAACSITGYSNKALLDTLLEHYIPTAHTHRFQRHLDLLQEQGISQIELHLQRHDGTEIIIELSSVQVSDEHFIHVFDDVTQQRQARAEIERARAAAEAANMAKSQFLASISHELRTPLNGIIGMGQLTLLSELNEQQRHDISLMVQSGQTLLRLVNDLLDSAKVESGKMSYESHPFDIQNILSELTPLKNTSKPLSIEFHLATEVPRFLQGDALRITQCLRNLLSNAIKFTEQGSVNLYIDTLNNKQIRFRVQDSGIGIAPETLAQLFKPFSQADNSISRRFGGTGLGLYLTREMACGMGGDLSVESQPNIGSCFTLTLPLHIAEHSMDAAHLPQVEDIPLEFAGKHILIAEDNPINLVMLKRWLDLAQVHTTSACNGIEAIQFQTQNPDKFDLILMDVQMPELDGLSATRQLRLQGCTCTIIGLSAGASKAEQQACLDAGMNDFLAKPIDLDELWGCFTRWLPPDYNHQSIASASETAVERFLNDEAALKQARQLFYEHNTNTPATLHQLCKQQDWASMSKLAHSLKGASATVGFSHLTTLAQQLEEIITTHPVKEHKLPALIQLIEALLHDKQMSDRTTITVA